MKRLVLSSCVILLVVAVCISAFGVTGGGDLTFRPSGVNPVVFSHDVHVKSKGLRCSGCHYAMFMMTNGSYKMDLKKITKNDFCKKCHNGQKSFDVGNADNCVKCHR
jgi:c(7)-type cytochrome triheme protein